MRDKRAQFFVGVAIVCFALIPLAQDEYRSYTFVVAVTYTVMALASALDSRSRHRERS